MKSYAQISASVVISWIKIGLTGILFSIVCILIGGFSLAFHYSSEKGLDSVFAEKPLAIVLIVFSIIAGVLYFILAKKTAIMTAINQVWKNKLSDFILPKIESYILRLSEKQPNWLAGITNSNFTHTFIDCVSQDKTINKVQRLILKNGIKKVKLENSDFTSVPLLSQIVTSKIEATVQSYTNPSHRNFYLLIILQIILLIAFFVF